MSAGHSAGSWRQGRVASTVITDQPVRGVESADEVEFYGGYLIAESISAEDVPLIVAAPKLLAALERMVATYGHLDGYAPDGPSDEARAAIAQATGAEAPPAKVKCENCGKVADTKYDGEDMCRDCATYGARRDFEEGDMPGGDA